jgi:integrase
MPKPKKYWGVEKNLNRHGRPRWYFRRPDMKAVPRIRLPDSYGTVEFEQAWCAARAGQPVTLPPGQGRARARQSRGSLGWLITDYLQSAEFKGARPATCRIRRGMLEKLAAEKGAVDIEDIDQAAIQSGLEARRSTPHMARAWLTCNNGLFDWATRERRPDPMTDEMKPILEANPCAGVRRLPIPKSADPDEEVGYPTWSEEQLAYFEAAYKLGSRERRAYEIFLLTGLRIGDASRLGRQHVQKDGTIKIRTEKTRIDVFIDITPRLKRALDAGPHGDPQALAFITGARGKPMAKGDLGKWFVSRCKAIGLNDRSAHGLRKAAARRYAEAGKTVNQLMALFGWKDARIAMHYVAMADRKRLALDAQRSMNWDETVNAISPTRF